MKRTFTLAVIWLALAYPAGLGIGALVAHAGPRCMTIAPICNPGFTSPVCICEPGSSGRCSWVCVGK